MKHRIRPSADRLSMGNRGHNVAAEVTANPTLRASCIAFGCWVAGVLLFLVALPLACWQPWGAALIGLALAIDARRSQFWRYQSSLTYPAHRQRLRARSLEEFEAEPEPSPWVLANGVQVWAKNLRFKG